ncbi:MAG: 3,4-dihydroxy-2-butanone-4-phosphate synthase, partial [Candidatus Thermoplasmatota archaeon]
MLEHSWKIERAIELLKQGKFILIYDADSRERETDIVIPAQFVTSEVIKKMRKDAGGLICVTLPYFIKKKLSIPYLTEIYQQTKNEIFDALAPYDIPYDNNSSFGITINHRKTFTGITDIDRALTISEFARIVFLAMKIDEKDAKKIFGKNFRSPGHVPTLIAASALLNERAGHTELSTALLMLSDLIPSACICELMGEYGKAMSKDEAVEYAYKEESIFLEGAEIIE